MKPKPARLWIKHDNGERSIECGIEAPDAYPDAIDQARAQLIKLHRETLITEQVLEPKPEGGEDA